MLGIQTRGCRIVGADETTGIWWPPKGKPVHLFKLSTGYFAMCLNEPHLLFVIL